MLNNSSYGIRRRAREMALQLLFQNEFLTHGNPAQPVTPALTLKNSPKEVLRRFVQDFSVETEVAEYGSRLFMGTFENLAKIDGEIQNHSAHWKTSRMGIVDLSIMRVAVYEMRFMDPAIPPSVAINEAVEIAKKYGSTESGSFVNGILDQVGRSLA